MAQPLKALLLAAGTGTRLRPLTDVLPKCLMPINGRPLLGMWLEALVNAGVTDITVNLHHHADLVRTYVQSSPFAPYVNLSHEEVLLGTGGTLLCHKERFAGAPFLLAHADNLTIFDVAKFVAAHEARPTGCVLTMMTFITEFPKQCGIVEINGNGVVIGFHEKVAEPPGDLANAGIYLIDDALFFFLEGLGRPMIDFSTEVIPQVVGRIFAFHNDRYHRDIGTLVSLIQAQFEYPLIDAAWDPCRAGYDPWYGLMRNDGSRLERDFMHALWTSVSSHWHSAKPVA